MFIEFSPIHGSYRDLIILANIDRSLKTKPQLSHEQIMFCANFGFSVDDQNRNQVSEAIESVMDQWLIHHPTLQDFYEWDYVRGLGDMLKHGNLTLFMLLLLNDSPRTVIYLQSLYFPNLDTYDGKVSTLLANYRRYHVDYRELENDSLEDMIDMVTRSGIHLPKVLELLCVTGDISSYKSLLDCSGTNPGFHHFEMCQTTGRGIFIQHCRFRRLRFIKLLIEFIERPHFTSRPADRQTTIDILMDDIKKAGDDDFGLEVVNHLVMINRLPPDRTSRYFKLLMNENMPKTCSKLLDLM